MLNHIKKHWRGDLSLSISFWVNIFLLNILLNLTDSLITNFSSINNPVSASQIAIIFSFFTIVIVYPWQIVGIWRCTKRYIENNKRKFWANFVQVLIVIGVIGTLGRINASWPTYKDLFEIGFEKDKFSNYEVEFLKQGNLIHLKGGLVFGVSKEVQRLINQNKTVKGIILDSIGGRIYESREISRIIKENNFNTYSLTGCYSACAMAFINGKKRYLAKGANLAFHQYSPYSKNLEQYYDISLEQGKDLENFEKQGISQSFINSVFKASKNDMWYPTKKEMLDAGVIHGVVNPSDLKVINYDSSLIKNIENELTKNPAIRTVKKFAPKVYDQILEKMKTQIKKGASEIEILQLAHSLMGGLADKALPSTSNKALIKFTKATIQLLGNLEKRDPILCMKYLYPSEYGPIIITEYLSSKELFPMLNSVSLVIEDSYINKNSKLDNKAGEELFQNIKDQLGSDSQFLEAKKLENKADYSKACKTIIKFYELILKKENQIASNGLRYAFSP